MTDLWREGSDTSQLTGAIFGARLFFGRRQRKLSDLWVSHSLRGVATGVQGRCASDGLLAEGSHTASMRSFSPC